MVYRYSIWNDGPIVDLYSEFEVLCIWIGKLNLLKDTQYPLEEAEIMKPEETIEGMWWRHGTKKQTSTFNRS